MESNELLPLATAIHRSRERAASPANVCMYSFTYDIFSDVDGFSHSKFWIHDPGQSYELMLDCRKDFEEKFVNFSTIAVGAMLVAFFEFGPHFDRFQGIRFPQRCCGNS